MHLLHSCISTNVVNIQPCVVGLLLKLFLSTKHLQLSSLKKIKRYPKHVSDKTPYEDKQKNNKVVQYFFYKLVLICVFIDRTNKVKWRLFNNDGLKAKGLKYFLYMHFTKRVFFKIKKTIIKDRVFTSSFNKNTLLVAVSLDSCNQLF
ncbi:hypothetical protein CDIK_3450 [Cucumispora dikerogammari]|nr:hypothetical protein CDIK_3450 [Cucumispora dikerogammari]